MLVRKCVESCRCGCIPSHTAQGLGMDAGTGFRARCRQQQSFSNGSTPGGSPGGHRVGPGVRSTVQQPECRRPMCRPGVCWARCQTRKLEEKGEDVMSALERPCSGNALHCIRHTAEADMYRPKRYRDPVRECSRKAARQSHSVVAGAPMRQASWISLNGAEIFPEETPSRARPRRPSAQD